MLFRYLYTIILLFIIGCSSGPDYKRDNILDPEASHPKAKFIPSCCYERAVEEFDSFSVVVNAAVTNQNLTLELISDVDGVIFSKENVTTDTLKVGYTKLSGPTLHTISLFIDGVKQDEVKNLVSKAHQVKMYEPTWHNFQPTLKWSKYEGDDFESYKLKIFNYSRAETVKEFTDINDTVFTHQYSFRENFNYFIETTSNSFFTSNNSNEIEIKQNIFKYPYSSLIFYDDQLHIYYLARNYQSGTSDYYLNSFSSKNESKTKSIGNFYPRGLGFISTSALSSPAIYVTSGDDINVYDATDLTLISEIRNLSERVKTHYDNDNIESILYNKLTSNYFISFSSGYESGPFTLDSNFEPIENNLSVDDKNASFLLGTNENILFAVDSYYPYNLISYSFNQVGGLEKTNEVSLIKRSKLSKISKKHNMLFLGSNGKIFSANSNLDDLGFLPSVNGGYSSFHIKESSQDTLYAATNEGYLHKIHIPSNQIVFSQKYHYGIEKRIERILSYNDELFLILDSYGDLIIVPKKPDDLNLD